MDAYRLPQTVVPRVYTLELRPDLVQGTFEGSIRIAVEVREPAAEVWLNAAELTDLAATGATVSLDEATERCLLRFDPPLPAGPAQLHLTFRGTLNDQLRGFYRSRFRDDAGKEHALAATQFEATDARRAFPCFDEPSFKAV